MAHGNVIFLQQSRAEHRAEENGGAASEERLECRIPSDVGDCDRRAGSSSNSTARARRCSTGRSAAGILASWTVKTRRLAGAVAHVFDSSLWDAWEFLAGELSNLPSLAAGRALAGAAALLVATIAAGLSLCECSLESLEIGSLGDRVAADVHKTVTAALLRVLVDKTTGVDGRHLWTVESAHFLELALVGDAAVLGEEERDAVAAVLLHLLVPAGDGEGAWVAPRVIVERKEVAALVFRSAVHVCCHVVTVILDISGRVANWDLTIAHAGDVGLHITCCRFHIWSCVSGIVGVDDLSRRSVYSQSRT